MTRLMLIIILPVLCNVACKDQGNSRKTTVLLQGKILNGSRDPVASALIEVIETTFVTNLTDNNNGFQEFRKLLGTARSANDGSFEIEVVSGSQQSLQELVVSKPPLPIHRVPIILTDDNSTDLIEIILHEHGEEQGNLEQGRIPFLKVEN